MQPIPGAYIDLKNVEFILEDGYVGDPGAVNNGAGYAIGASTIVVDAIVTPMVAGDEFTFASHDTIYTATGTPTTTSLSFTPALTHAILDNEVITVLPHRLIVKIGEGNLTYSEKKTREFKKDRGKLDQVRNGDEMEMDVNFQFAWTYLSSSSGSVVPSVEEFLKQKGPAVNYKSTGGACEPYSVNILIRNSGDPSTCSAIDEQIEEIRLPRFYYEDLAHDAKAGTIAATGKCNATEAQITRVDA